MKNPVSIVLLFSLMLAGALRVNAADKKNDPSRFPLAVHISASAYSHQSAYISPVPGWYEIITATIDGKHYQLQGPTSSPTVSDCCNGLVNPGDYRAKLVKDEHITSYESFQRFEILFPDGTTRRFDVIAQSE